MTDNRSERHKLRVRNDTERRLDLEDRAVKSKYPTHPERLAFPPGARDAYNRRFQPE